jgi:hypothetical protein
MHNYCGTWKWLNMLASAFSEQGCYIVTWVLWVTRLWNSNEWCISSLSLPWFQKKLQVIHRTLYWIYLRLYLLLSDQRGDLDTRCTQLMVLARTGYFQPAWLATNADTFLPWLLPMFDSLRHSDPWFVNSEYLKLRNKNSSVHHFDAHARAMLPISGKKVLVPTLSNLNEDEIRL